MKIEAIMDVTRPRTTNLCALVLTSRNSNDRRRFPCQNGTVGNIVRITENEVKSPLTLCEVEVYARIGKITLHVPRRPRVI